MRSRGARQRIGYAAFRRWAMLLALSLAALLAPCIAAADPPLPTDVDAGDLDPAIFSLLDALLHVQNVPGPGALRSVTTDGRGLMLHFENLVLLLPAGDPDAATVLPLVAPLLSRQATVTLLPNASVTYGLLAADAPRAGVAAAAPVLLNAGGVRSALPAGALPSSFGAPTMRVIAGFDVPAPFADLVTPDAPARPIAHTPEAIAHQALDLMRAGLPLREPVWIGTADGYRLVQPFTRRVLVWDPLTNSVSATDVAEMAQSERLVPDGGAGGAFLAAILVRLTQVPDGIGVAVMYATPRGALMVSRGGTARYPAASVMKLAILAACEDAIARGDLPRSGDIDSLEEAMIVSSDNDAANELIDTLGRQQINAVMRRLGMTDSYLGSHFDVSYGDDDDDDYLTPRESLVLMNALVRGDIGNTERIRDLLSRSQAPGSVRDALAAEDSAVPIYEKRGWYDGVENDVVRLDLGHDTIVTIAVFQPEVEDVDAAWALFADLARLGVESGS